MNRLRRWLIHKLHGYTLAERNAAYATGWQDSANKDDPTAKRWLRATWDRIGNTVIQKSYVGNNEYDFWEEQGPLDVRVEIKTDSNGYRAELIGEDTS